MKKVEIVSMTADCFQEFTTACNGIGETLFFAKPDDRWSVAEHARHLVLSTRTTTLAFGLPRILVRLIGGRPGRVSTSFDELSNRYYQRLKEGARASGRYVPKEIDPAFGRERLMAGWKKATRDYLAALNKNRTENDLDRYQVKHPLLGHITLRELCYFTIFHTRHHTQSILDRKGVL